MLKTLTNYSSQHVSKNLPITLFYSPIIPILLFCFIISSAWKHPRKQGAFVIGTVTKVYSMNVSDTSKMVNESHLSLFKIIDSPHMPLFPNFK